MMFINNRLTLYPDRHSKAIHLKFALYGTIFGTVVARSVATKQSSGLNSGSSPNPGALIKNTKL
ncbi:TPA: hypothetical protein JBF45_14015 [Legionella pneumophila]|nr:hypothetical protein [Legionella pneumophila]